jgi:hypothetical protein
MLLQPLGWQGISQTVAIICCALFSACDPRLLINHSWGNFHVT